MPWQLLTNHAEILAIHAAFMGFGQILYFGGDEHDPARNKAHKYNATRLYDCGSTDVTEIKSPAFDAFCSGHAFLGIANQVKILVAGGTDQFNAAAVGLHHDHFPGLRDAAIFSSPNFLTPAIGGWVWSSIDMMNNGLTTPPSTEIPNPNPQLSGGRWYPTLLTLPNGEVIAFSGHPGSNDKYHNNNIPEIFSPIPDPMGHWRQLTSYSNNLGREYYSNHEMPLYPRVHLLPSGDIVCTNPIGEDTYTFLPNIGPYGGVFTRICGFPGNAIGDFNGYGSTSVLLPLRYRENYRGRVMICGGTSISPLLLDLKGWEPSLANSGGWNWVETGPRAIRRRRVNANATILPTGEILITGGIDSGRGEPTLDVNGVRQAEIYDPYNNAWTVVAEEASSVRNYHSVALLMPDGRVWHAGSDHDGARGLAARNLDIEIFEPWYYGDPDRPYILAAPSLAYPGETIYLESTFAEEIQRVVLLRCGSCTHAFNPDQRLIELKFRYVTGDILLAEMPPNNFIMPPGPYFIYTIRKKVTNPLGLPSAGTDIYIVPEKPNDSGRPRGL